MFDFENAAKQLAEKPAFKEEAERLISLILSDKKFVFNKHELPFEPVELVKEKVVSLAGDQFELLEHNLFYYLAYTELAKQFSYSVINDPEALFNFLRNVHDYFVGGNYKRISRFLKGLDTII